MGQIKNLRELLSKNPNITNEELQAFLNSEDEEAKDGEVMEEEIKEEVKEEVEETPVETEEEHPQLQTALQKISQDAKAITEVGIKDVQVRLDTTKTAGEQVKEVVDYAATVGAVQDASTVKQIAEHKKEELIANAEVKAKGAKKESVQSDTDLQKAKRAKFQLLFDTFGVADHIPDWLLKILMCIFAPFYVLFVIAIGIPTGFVRFLIDCIDGVLIRYDKAEETRKPKIKVTVWVVLALMIAAAICLTLLKCFHVI